MNRTQVQTQTLYEAADIFTMLSALAIGDRVPETILIIDYNNGDIPPWTLKEKEVDGPLHILTLVDASTLSTTAPQPKTRRRKKQSMQMSMFEEQVEEKYVAVDVFTAPEKTLATPLFTWMPGCEHARGMLADIRQHARQLHDQQLADEEVA
jgi:hypothetical protein